MKRIKLSKEELLFLQSCIHEIKQEKKTALMKHFIQHGDMTTYQHCERVMICSYKLARRLPFRFDHKSLVRGAFLHDYYLYDWHEKDDSHKWHGYHHADKALENADKIFHLNEREKQIIYSHMWPLNLFRIPKNREAFLVCMVDKYCSVFEVFYKNQKTAAVVTNCDEKL